MIRHDDKANTLQVDRLKLMIENAEHDAFGLIEVEQLAILEDRKRDEMDVALVGEVATIVTHTMGLLLQKRINGWSHIDYGLDNLQADLRFCLLTSG
jgi:hypothetical protein